MKTIHYKNALICPHERGFDVVVNNKWFVRHSVRSAKWWITVYNRFTDEAELG